MKITVCATLGIVKQRLVYLFKVKGESDSFLDLAIAEYWTLDIKRQLTRILGWFVFLLIFDDVFFIEIFTGITRGLVFGVVFYTQIKGTCFKRFKGDIIIEVIIVANGVEILAFTVYW